MIMQTEQWVYYTNEHCIPFTPQFGDEWATDRGGRIHPMPDHPDIVWFQFGYGQYGDTLSVSGFLYRRPTGKTTPKPTEADHFL